MYECMYVCMNRPIKILSLCMYVCFSQVKVGCPMIEVQKSATIVSMISQVIFKHIHTYIHIYTYIHSNLTGREDRDWNLQVFQKTFVVSGMYVCMYACIYMYVCMYVRMYLFF